MSGKENEGNYEHVQFVEPVSNVGGGDEEQDVQV